jgi:two-component system chemotaxis response regulator CheB
VEALLSQQGETVEAALWSAVNALQERAATFRRLAGRQRNQQWFEEQAQQIEREADALVALLRGLITNGQIG